MIDPSLILDYAVETAFALVMISILLGFIRLVKGPTLADRVVAIDMMTVSIVAFCALFSIRTSDPVFLDVAVVLALIGFLATVALARFAERRVLQDEAAETPPEEHDPDGANE